MKTIEIFLLLFDHFYRIVPLCKLQTTQKQANPSMVRWWAVRSIDELDSLIRLSDSILFINKYTYKPQVESKIKMLEHSWPKRKNVQTKMQFKVCVITTHIETVIYLIFQTQTSRASLALAYTKKQLMSECQLSSKHYVYLSNNIVCYSVLVECCKVMLYLFPLHQMISFGEDFFLHLHLH